MNFLHYSKKLSVLFFILVIVFLITNNLTGQSYSQKGTSPDKIPNEFNKQELPGTRDAGDGYPYPPHWERPESSRVEPHFLIVNIQANPRIGDIPIQEGDYIGAFFVGDNGTLVCGGAGYWKADSAIIFAITGDDPQTTHKEGFSYGAVINYKLFSFTTMKDYTVTTITFDTSPNSGFISGVKWYPLALSSATNVKASVTFDAYATVNQSPICTSESTQLNAVVFIGPGEPYTYNWTSNPAGFSSTLKSPVVSPGSTTQYLLTAHSGSLTSEHSVTLVVNVNPTVNAGTDGTLCPNGTFQLSSQASDYSSVLWSTDGDGTFSDPTILNPVYIFGLNDMQDTSVILSISALPLEGCITSASDEMVLTILPLPAIDLGPDALICVSSAIPLNPTAHNYSTVHWTTSGDGTFSNANIINPLYTPGPSDNSSATVNLTCTVSAASPCAATVMDQIKYDFVKAPTASGPASKTVCETNSTVAINGAATNYSSILWTTAGDGTFLNPTVLAVTYCPGTNDKQNGLVVVTLNAFPNTPCTLPATKPVNVIIKKLPVVTISSTDKVCQGYPLQLNANGSNYYGISWSTTGNGIFNSTTILNPVYTPGTSDIEAGFFKVVLKGTPLMPCSLPDYDTLQVTIVGQPTVEINTTSNQVLCTTEPLSLSATANDYNNLLWTTSGDGSFSYVDSLNPVYWPGPETDISGYPVSLTLTAYAVQNCGSNVDDQISVSFLEGPVSDAGQDATICSSSTYQLSGAATYTGSILWTSSGDGTFDNPAILNPVYSTGIADNLSDSVILSLTATNVTPCTVSKSDLMVLTISGHPIANAGIDDTVAMGSVYFLANASAQNATTFLWSTLGDGTFNNPNICNPIYTPGDDDITNTLVSLIFTADNEYCDDSSDTITLTVQDQSDFPTSYAGTDATICIGNSYLLVDAQATQFSSLIWSTAGDGTFSNPNLLNPNYTPGANDIINGLVMLCLKALPNPGITFIARDSVELVIQKTPTANAGTDATVCQGSTHTLAGAATNQNSVTWTTSGNGTFSSTSSLTPVYTPGTTDVTNGSVSLTLAALAISPCTVSATDTKILTIQKTPTANAGTDATVCQGSTHTLAGAATNQNSVTWTTSGNGTFSSTTTLNPTYTPGTTDVTNGSVTLTLAASAISPCMVSATDTKTLTIQKTPTANAGTDATVCQGSSHTLAGAATNQNSVTWTTSGNGTFSSTSSLTPVYTPGTTDVTNGTVTLSLTASAISPCTASVTDSKILIIQKTPTANAGSDATVCQGSSHTLAGAATNQNSVTWITSGNGTFSSTTTLNPTYTPGTTDVTNGSVTLTLAASAISPCMVSATDTKTLTIEKTPTANAGTDATVCQGSSHTLAGAATNQNSVTWTTSGNGTFSSTSSLTPVYTPGTTDVTNGTVTLSLTASAISPCTASVTDSKILIIQKTPTANAGSDATVCQGSSHTLAGAATNQNSVTWTTSGNGTFSSTSSLTPVYTPGTTDVTNGSVTLTLTASAISPCMVSATDTKTLTIQKTPTANAGTDATVCQGSTHTLAGAATNQNSVTWTTSGNGTFSSTTTLNPTYTSGTTDITNGSVTLTLAASAISPCMVSATDTKTLTIQKTPTANAGTDATVCQGSTHTLAGAATNQNSVTWTTSGNGTFSSTTTLNPTYTPGTTDITNGSVTLTLAASAISPCMVSATDTKTLTIQKTPTANAGTDATVCQGSTHTLAGAATNQNSVTWTTSGNGTFSSTSSLTPIYTPGATDVTNGTVTLTFTASAISPCSTSVSDTKILTIQEPPVSFAGQDATIPMDFPYPLTNAFVENATSVFWSTSGDGDFFNTTELHTTYSPGPGDYLNGAVILTLTAENNFCSPVSHSMNLNFLSNQEDPIANAGIDVTLCNESNYLLSEAEAQNYSTLLWTTSGDGTFDDATLLNPVYTPGDLDKSTGSAELCIEAQPIFPSTYVDVDCMILSIQKSPVADAGDDATVCEQEMYLLDGTGENFTSVLWTTTGNGTFSSTSSLTPVYTPGATDITNGSVTLTLTASAISPCTVSAVDSKTLSIQKSPLANAGTDATICQTETYQLSGTAQNYSSVLWSTAGNGTFSSTSSLTPVYTPCVAEIADGLAVLTLSANPVSPCSVSSTDVLNLIIQKLPTANVGADATICQGSSLQLNGTAQFYQGVLWTTTGNGTFSSSSSLTPVYTPGPSDISAGSVTLVMMALASSPCTSSSSDHMVLTLQTPPTANAGTDATICQTETYQLSGTAQNYSSVLWSTAGNGTFSSTSSLTPVYTPCVAEIADGLAVLTLTANPVSPCSVADDDVLNLIIQKLPTANVGADATICQGSSFQLNGTAQFNQGVLWTTTGNGTFSSTSSLTPVYTPGPSDISAGSVTLVMMALASSPCTSSSSDHMVLTLQTPPTANAGTDATICQTETYQLSGTAQNYSSVLWSTSGDGTFSSTSSLNPVYTPGVLDIENGIVTLMLDVSPVSPCLEAASDLMSLFIQKNSVVYAGDDATFCTDQLCEISGNAQFIESVMWLSTGDGYFEDPFSTGTIYYPGPEDLNNKTIELCLVGVGINGCPGNEDCLIVTFVDPPTISAGDDLSICEDNKASLQASATNYSSLLWTTSGDGTFDNMYSISAIYTPGNLDKISGSVELCLEALAQSGCESVNDCVSLSLLSVPMVYAGSDASIQQGLNFVANEATASDYSSIQWTTSGNGSFDDATVLETEYSPSELDYLNGNVTLTIVGHAVSPCEIDASDELLLSFTVTSAFAGDDAIVCTNTSFQTAGSATNYASVKWSTSGDGTFDDDTNLSARYFAGAEDISAGFTELCLTVLAPVNNYEKSDCMNLSFQQPPTFFAGNDATILFGEPFLIEEALAENYDQIQWFAVNGTGFFSNETVMNPYYYPGQLDALQDYIVLGASVSAIQPCEVSAEGFMHLSIISECQDAIAEAGDDINICNNQASIQLLGSGSNYGEIHWTSGGSGYFEYQNSPEATYFLSETDKLESEITFYLHATAVDTCADASDSLKVFIQSAGAIFAGNDVTICEDENVLLEGNSSITTNLLWTTEGDGIFSDLNVLNPVYSPGSQDLTEGNVTLCLHLTEGSCEDNSDCIMVTFQKSPVVLAGDDATICEGSNHILDGSATNHESVLWSTSGNGTFDSAGSLTTIYTPGTTDVTNGTVTLTLTAAAISPCTISATDAKILTIQKTPTANAGNDATICEGSNHILDGTATNQESVLWTTSGNGTFGSAGSLTPDYTPGTTDVTNGTVTLTLTAAAISPCTISATDAKILSIQTPPTANAGNDASICEGEIHVLDGSVTNQESVLWTTSGNGTFDSAGSLTTIYTPGTTDVTNGTVTLTLTAAAISPCTISATDAKILTIQKTPTANAGNDATICEGSNHILDGTATNQESVLWSTSGNGTFGSSGSPTTVYTPGTTDVTNGTVTLTLTAAAISPCTISATDTKILSIQTPPTANAGADATICQTETYQLSGSAQNYSSVLWSTAGNGTFSSSSSLNPVYTPGTTDVTNGTVTLILTASPVSPCTISATDAKILTIQKTPTANAGNDATICEGSNHILDGTATNQESVLWTTSGNGTFGSAGSPTTIYTPGTTDVTNGTVTLTLTASAISPCIISATDSKILSIQTPPTANAGADATICQNETYQLSGSAQNYSSVLWSTAGNGTFSSSSSLNPVYTPCVAEIANGLAVLTLSAIPVSPCSVASTDLFNLTIQQLPTANVGADATICQESSYQLNGTAQYYQGVLWTTTGNGTFSSSSSLTPVYTPGSSDISAGSVTLVMMTLAISPCTSSASDFLILTIQSQPTVNAGNNASIPKQETYTLVNASAENYSEVAWATIIGTGDFDFPEILNPTFIPSEEDYEFGYVELELTALPINPCNSSMSDVMTLSFEDVCHDAVADAGNDQQVCIPGIVQLNGVASYSNLVLWETDGDGTFTNQNSLVTEYIPGTGDINQGNVELCLTAFANEPCLNDTDCIIVSLPKSPSASAGSDVTICENTLFVILQGAATNYTSVQWSTSGTGTFQNSSSLTTKYVPSLSDKSVGQVEIFLVASNNNCDPNTDSFILVINHTPIILLGDDATICSNKSFFNSGSFVLNTDSIRWTTSGDGTFSDQTIEENEYFPGTNDINNGFADLCLTGFAADQCADVTECLTLTILPSPVIEPGNDLTVCENASIQMNVTASLYDEIEWTTAGDGTFSDPNILNPVYSPGLADMANESVILTINAYSQNNCDDASDEILLTIEKNPEVLAGSDFTVCQNTPVQLNGQAQNYSSVYWSTQGDGTFDNTGKLDAVYFTGSADVEQGFVELCLYANPVDVCTVSADCLIVTMMPAPSAIAGEDLTICETSAVVLNGQASYYAEILWSTTGDGTFDNIASLNTTYFLGTSDQVNGNTSLCLTATGTDGCENDEDCLLVSYLQTAQVEAGSNIIICQGDDAYLNGEAAFVESTVWSTSGDGSFNDVTIPNPVYSPGAQDLLAGNITLYLTGTTQLTCGELFDSLLISIQKPPTFFAGNDETILWGEAYPLDGAVMENGSLIQWFTTNGTGFFSNENDTNPVYYPGQMDAIQDYIVLAASVSAIQPCVVSTDDEMHLSIISECQDAVAEAGDDITICNSGNSIQLSAIAENYDLIDWTSGGSGYFENQNDLDATYFLSDADMLETEITLYLHATAFGTCSNATDSIKIFIQPAPFVVAGNDLTICQNQVAELINASAAGYSSITWSTGGDGTFADENQEATSYTPGELDILNRQVTLTLTAAPNAPCSVLISSELLLNIQGDIVIYEQIADTVVTIGDNIDFTIGADFAGQYAWFGPQGLIPDATGPVLSITNVLLDDAGSYYCEISNSCGTINSSVALLTVNQIQVIIMPAGWSGISSWITPNELDLELLFAPMGDNLILLKNFDGVCYPGLKINTLVMWDTQIGYEIKILAADSFSFVGFENMNKNVNINQGWNYLPVLSTCPIDVQTAFGGNTCIDIIKEIAGSGIYWPAMNINSIGYLKPGKAYLLRANQACTYTFPSCSSKSGIIQDNSVFKNNSTWSNPVFTPSTHLVAFDDQLLETLRFGDVIGAFTLDGRCAGLMEIEDHKNALTIFADDVYTPESDGFAENEIMTFRLYRQATGEEFELNISFDMSFPNNNGMFAANGVSRVYKAVLNSVYEPCQSSINVFPNPARGKVNIVGLTGSVKIEIYNTEGQLLRTEACNETNDNQPFAVDLSGYNSGIIYLRIITKQNVVITKVILQ